MTLPETGPSLPPSHAVLEQAAHWYAVLRDGKACARDQTAWQDWLHADDAHRTAWGYVENIGRNFTPLRGQADARLAADALGQATRHRHTRRRILAGAALVTGGTLLGYLGWRDALLPAGLMALGADHRTGVGEQRQISLADGSQVWLNTASAINVEIDDRVRTVTLVDGEIFITTAKDASRPFFVQTQYGRMQALGTQFTVRSQADRMFLAVYEGAVELRIPSGVRVLKAGQQVRFSATGIFATETADSAREAWTQGVLIADNIPLRQVVDELRRYRRGHLGVADEVAELTVYGHFPIQDSERVLRMLSTVLPVRIAQPLPWWTSIEARR